MSFDHREALIVFAKPPVPGKVKTRLTPLLSDEEAARLYEAFLRDALDRYTKLEADVRWYWSRPADMSLPVSDALTEHVQQGEGLGARMRRAFRETLEGGYDRAVIVGTDHPTLLPSFAEEAFAALSEPEHVCIGPSEDGGYYLLGMEAFYPQLFEGMTYSHADVFRKTMRRAEEAGLLVTVLPRWYDVDTPGDLRRLARDLDESEASLPFTRAVMEELQGRGNRSLL